MKIILLQGGQSSERDISLRSSQAIAQAILNLHHDLVTIDPIEYEGIEYLIMALKKEKPDLVFIGLHGAYGEDGTIQAILRACHIPFTGSGHLATAIAWDKYISASIAKIHDLPVPRQDLLHAIPQDLKQLIEYIQFPMFVKPNQGGSSIGASIAYNHDELVPAMQLALQHDRQILIQQYIQGTELTVSILGDQILPIVEIVPHNGFYNYENKYTSGKTEYICPARLSPSQTYLIQRFGEKIYRTTGCCIYGRVDFLFDGNDLYFLEINTLPGMTNLSLVPMAAQQIGLSFEELIAQIIDLSLKRTF